MDLSKFSDAELRDELERRREIRRKLVSNPINYRYMIGEVMEVDHPSANVQLWRYKIRSKDFITEGAESPILGKIPLCTSIFNRITAPKVGDCVKLRYREGKGFSCNVYYSRICEILPKNEKND